MYWYWQYLPYVLPLIASAAVLVWVTIFAMRSYPLPGSIAAATLALGGTIYALGYAAEILVPGTAAKITCAKIEYVGIALIPSAWLIFVLRYTGREIWMSYRSVVLLGIEPFLTILITWTNESHHLMWTDAQMATGSVPVLDMAHGNWFYFNALYSASLILVGVYFLSTHLLNKQFPNVYRRQMVVLMTGILIPLISSLLRVVGVRIAGGLDITPFTFLLTGLAILWAIPRYRLFEGVPVAQAAIVKSMSDGVAVLNIRGYVAGINRAMERIIGRSADEIIGMPVEEAFAVWPELLDKYDSLVRAQPEETQAEIVQETAEGRRVYDMHHTPLYDRWGGFTGRILVLRDITARKQAEEVIERERRAYRIISEAAVEDTDIAGLCRHVLEGLIDALPFDFGTIRLCDKSGGLLYPAAVVGLSEEEIRQKITAQPLDAADNYVGVMVARTRQPIFAPDVSRHPISQTHKERLEEMGVRALIGYPLLSADGELLGILQLLAHTPLPLQEGDNEFFTTVARMFSLVLERRLEAALLETQKRLFESLVAVARAATERPTPEDVLRNVLEVVTALTGAENGSLFLMDGDVVIKAILARGQTTPREERDLVGRVMTSGLAGWVVENRETAIIDDTTTDERWLPLPDAPYTVRSVLAVPIINEGNVVGVLTLSHSAPGHFDAEQANLMRAAADQMALALRNAQIFEAQRRLADRQITLYEMLRTVSGHLDPRTASRVAVDTIATLTGWDAVAILLPDDAEEHLIVEAASGIVASAQGWRIPAGQGVTWRAFRTGETQYVPDVTTDPDYVAGHSSIRCELAVPLRRSGQVLGVLNIESNQPDDMDVNDIQLAESLADALALAVDNARLFQEVAVERGRLQALIESARDGVVLVGMNRRVLVINAAGLEALGLPGEPEEWVNRPLWDAIRAIRRNLPELMRTLVAEMRRVQNGDEPPGEGEYTFGHRVIHWLHLPVMAGTTPLGRLVVLRDVTEERLLERMRDDLTHTLVHDLRNPLTAISAALQILDMSSDVLSENSRHMLNVAASNTQRMIELVNAILDVSRLESGRMQVEREPVPLPVLISEVLEAQEPLAKGYELRLENAVPNDLPLVYIDKKLIGRVLHNLIGNAIKFTPPGGHIRVSARSEEDKVLVSVSDTGPGIPPELRERLFQKFTTGRHARRGSGLGLAFCKMAVEAHGERIWLEDTPSGATFTFSLPVFRSE